MRASSAPRKYRGGFTVVFPLSDISDFDVMYDSLEIHQKIRQHDTATIRITSRSMQWFSVINSGAPVQVQYWGQNQSKAVFIGYVTNIHPVGTDDSGRYVREVVCVAASRELRRTDLKTYLNKTASEIIQTIGRDLKFNVLAKQHPLRRPTVIQSGESYWEFMNRLAKRSGYVLRVEETTIFFMPLGDLVATFKSRAPVLTDYGLMTVDGFSHANIESLEAWTGDTSVDAEDSADPALVTAVEPISGKTHAVREVPTSALVRGRTSRSGYTRYPDNMVAHSRKDAKLLAKGAADAGMMAFDATLRVAGDSYLRPYRTVELAVKDGTLNGYWIVKESVHKVRRGSYSTELTVSTDSVDGVSRSATNRGSRRRRDLDTELVQGFAPDLAISSKLQIVGDGFVRGKVGAGGQQGRWVTR